MQVRFANGQDRWLGREQAQPRVGCERGNQPNAAGDHGRDRGPDPGHAAGALHLAGADIGANHGHQRCAEAEDQRNLQILQSGRQAVASQGEDA